MGEALNSGAQGDEAPGWLMEAMPADPLMAMAWRGCLEWACGHPEVLKAFEEETGTRYVAPRTPLDRMIDAATGADESVARAFVQWFNANIWGDDSTPVPEEGS